MRNVLSLSLSLSLWLVLSCASANAQEYLTFQSPTGNILCGMYSGDYPGVRCDVLQLTPSFTAPPPDCEFDWGSSFWIGSGAAKGELGCVSDVIETPPFSVLPYDHAIDFGGVTCRSERTGVTCTNAFGHGFTVARGQQSLF